MMKFFIALIGFIFSSSFAFAQQKEDKKASMLCPPIVYPKQSRTKEEEGTVQLSIKINKDSTVGDILIEKSSGYSRLDSAAVELIQNCQIVAAVRDSIPYDSITKQRITFKLEGGTPKDKDNLAEDDRLKLERFRRLSNFSSSSKDFESTPYSERIARRIKPNTVYVQAIEGNPQAIVEIKCAEDGKIIGVRLVESSGNKGWDEAVLKAVIRTQSLPLDANGKAPPIILINFRPNE